jgi:hypothetical protein
MSLTDYRQDVSTSRLGDNDARRLIRLSAVRVATPTATNREARARAGSAMTREQRMPTIGTTG